MYDRLDQIFQLQKMCLNQLEEAQRNSEQYSSNMKMLSENMKTNWQKSNYFLTEYDSFVTNITAIMEVTRKYNLQMYLHNIKLTEMQALFTKINQKGETQSGSINKSKLKEAGTHLYPAEVFDINSEPPDEDFVYPRFNLSEVYKENAIISGRVTSIKSLNDLTFYIFDRSSKYRDTIVELAKSLELRQYHDMPPANEVFGYVLDKHIFRAVLSSKNLYDVEMDEEIFPGYILDTGEILPVKSNSIMYRLTFEQKSIPAQAIPCQLITTNKNPFVAQQEMEEKLRSLEYANCCHFKIVSIEDNILQVELANTDPDKTIDNSCIDPVSVSYAPLNTGPDNVKCKQLTDDELEMLYEEPLNTSNAMKAVMGYDPQDDKRICRFYDPEIGGCFKGVNCKLEHTLRQPDGWTKDVIPAASIIDCRHPTTIFPPGSIINITPTYIGRLDRFYAIINDPLQTATPLVWNDEDIPSWKHLKKPPHMFELVLSRYIDDLWYRAKIMSHDDDYKMFKVLYVDYGNYQVVHLRNLASIDMSIAQMPYQAILCRIEGVREKQSLSVDERKNAIEILCEMILNKSMDVKVTSHYEDLFISFIDTNEYPIPHKFVEMGFLDYNEI
ncbi:uncharacterized protein LOC119600656 [Lucilia sericata]|uniref:uncharacterized protein LOC119600656 n=1 Tax=Lucilia sericata TaxID=13632 RepID=UPI0018A82E37|nr:uncharacterized protein LOC119600656 [Lucilia sericata]